VTGVCAPAHQRAHSSAIRLSWAGAQTSSPTTSTREHAAQARRSRAVLDAAFHQALERAFLSLNNRDELIARCKHKVAQRPRRAATHEQLANGIPLFLDQLTRTLGAEEADEAAESLRISGPSGGDSLALSEMGVTATAHGKDLLTLGYSVDQVVP
jgi:acyl-CoA reductase-like NAD-dependent aldehyde dehydrogenase